MTEAQIKADRDAAAEKCKGLPKDSAEYREAFAEYAAACFELRRRWQKGF